MTKENRLMKKYLKRLQALQMKYVDLQNIEISICNRYTGEYIKNNDGVTICANIFRWKGSDVELIYNPVFYLADYRTQEDNEALMEKFEKCLADEYERQNSEK